MSNEGNTASAVLMAFALGALAGAAVALLYAPVPGEEARRRLAEKAREGRERASTMARQGGEMLRRQRETINHAIDQGVEAFERTRKESQ